MANKSKALVSLFATVFLSVLFFLPADKAEAAVTPGYYSPFSSISDNIECKKGYPYNKKNMQSGICRVNWNTVTENTINNALNSAVSGAFGKGSWLNGGN